MKTRGVTLIELLVAITLLGFVSLGLLFAMRTGVGAWQRANNRMAADRQVIAAGDLIATQLGSARAQYLGWGQREQRIALLYFEGRQDRLRFATDYSVASRNRGGVWLAEYWFEHNARNECRLMYNERPWREDIAQATVAEVVQNQNGQQFAFRPAVAGPATRVLYTGLHDCSFEYLIESLDRPVYWSVFWPWDPRVLPHAVAVRFKTPPGTRGVEPIPTVAMLNAREVYP